MTNLVASKPSTAPSTLSPLGEMIQSLTTVFRLDAAVMSDTRARQAIGDAYRDVIGQHSEEILARARRILLATRKFPTFPTPAEVADAILSAYENLGLPMSPDALRLNEDRMTSERYLA